MSRFAARRDASEGEIVGALRKIGCEVWRKLPVDLLVRLPGDPPGIFRCIEAKSPYRKDGAMRKRKDQQEQAEFVAQTGTPYLTSAEQAVAWVNQARGT